ncbi:MAG: tetratricopeptide repeat protein [Thermoanaerobaculia bacterium]
MDEDPTDGAPLSGAPTVDADGVTPPEVPTNLPGEVGGFPILRKLGEGGMGIVYEAEQQSPRRRVALKVVRGGQFVDETYLRMFRREAETLARLVHPNIAAIYEAGRTEDGQHFFTMELVTGETLSAYARRRLGGETPGPEQVRERVRLFETVCRAVNHAHQRGVIHRDLKPSNIVVSEAGDVKVLDFGLARITDADVAVGTVMTELGKIWGTLPYMSPEQTRGDSREIDFRSDVYALGVVLYELVSGRLPYDTQTGSLVQAVRTICEEPPRPLKEGAVDADLRTIVAKALEKDPDQRYQTAAALAEDVERWLAGQPILAHPPSTMYHLRKLAARHKGGVAAAGAIAFLVVALAATMTVQAQRVRRERDRAAAEAAKAGAINAFLQDALGAADPWGKGSRNVTLLEALRQARAKAEASLKTQPLVAASVLQTIGTTFSNLAEAEEADRALRAALELRAAAAGRTSAEAVESLVALSSAESYAKEFGEAERHAREALDVVRALHGEGSLETAPALYALATAVHGAGRPPEAKAMAEELLRIARAHRAGGTKEERDAAAKAETDALLVLIGVQATGDETESAKIEPLARERLALLKERFGERHPEVANAMNDAALGQMYAGDLAGAERTYLQVVEMDVALLGEDHPETASARENLGNVYARMKRFDRTAALLEKVLAARRRALGDDSEPVARSLANVATVHKLAGELDAAAKAYPEAIDRLTKRLGEEHPDVGLTLLGYGDTLRQQKKYAEAEVPLRRAVEILAKANGADSAMAQRGLEVLVKLCTDWGRPDRAEAYRSRLVPKPVAPATSG